MKPYLPLFLISFVASVTLSRADTIKEDSTRIQPQRDTVAKVPKREKWDWEFNHSDSASRDTFYVYCKHEYDTMGNHLSETRFDKMGKVILSILYTYDNKRNLVKIEEFDENQHLRNLSENDFDEQNRLVQVRQFYFENDKLKPLSKEQRVYDKVTGRKTQVMSFNPRNELIYTETFNYDKNGNLILSLMQAKLIARNMGDFETKFTYDAQGRIIQEEELDKDYHSQSKTIYKYDANGNLCEKQYYNEVGRIVKIELNKYDDLGRAIEYTELGTQRQVRRKMRFDYINFN